jgi:hypothetical protein
VREAGFAGGTGAGGRRRAPADATVTMTSDRSSSEVRELGDWFHNIDLGGVQTAPDHFLGDYPA